MDLVSKSGARVAARLGLSIRAALATGALLASPALLAETKPAAVDALVPLCTAGIEKGESDALGLYDVGSGLLSADFVDEDAAQNCLKATAANLTLGIGSLALNLTGSVQYADIAGPQRRVVATTIDPVLCESYYSASDKLALTLTNANSDVQGTGNLLRGVDTMNYSVATGQVTPALAEATYGPYIACASASTANAPQPVSAADRIFDARFESDADLQVEFLDMQGAPLTTMLQTVNVDSVYQVRVTNRGEGVAQNVRIREFVPKSTGQLTPNMNMTLATCVRVSDSANCEAADGTLRQDIASLAHGQSVTYTLTRRVNGSSPVPAPSGALTSVAAFVDPTQSSETNRANNSRSLRIGLVTNGVPIANAQNLVATEDQPLAIVLTGTDPEGTTLTYATANPSHGTLSGTAPNITFTPAADYSGPASFTFTVSDGLATSTPATVSITVTAVNDAPRVTAQLPDVTFAEGALLELHANTAFADPEGTALTYSATGLPPGINIFSNGTIGGTLSLSASGEYTIVVTATENAATALAVSDTFVLTVSNTNQNPTVATPIPDQTHNEGDVVSLDVAANFSDADAGDTFTYALAGGTLPDGLSLNPATGAITGTLTATAADGSPYTVTISANDGNGGSVNDTFTWTVGAVNFTPTAVGTLIDRAGTVGVLLNVPGADIRGGFSDPDGDTLTYSATGLPAGVNISPSDGTIIGTPASGTEGEHTVEVTATDGGALFATQSFTLTIAVP